MTSIDVIKTIDRLNKEKRKRKGSEFFKIHKTCWVNKQKREISKAYTNHYIVPLTFYGIREWHMK